jgi:hypothetical protein
MASKRRAFEGEVDEEMGVKKDAMSDAASDKAAVQETATHDPASFSSAPSSPTRQWRWSTDARRQLR